MVDETQKIVHQKWYSFRRVQRRKIPDQFGTFAKHCAYSEDCIYNISTTAISWKSLPGDVKSGEERLTLIICTNSTGTHKLALLVLGDRINLDCLGLFRPYLYYTNSLMDRTIFDYWYREVFLLNVKIKTREPTSYLLVLQTTDKSCFPSTEEINSIEKN